MKRVGKMNKESLTISSLGEFINAIKRVSSGTALYRQIIRRFINKIEITKEMHI